MHRKPRADNGEHTFLAIRIEGYEARVLPVANIYWPAFHTPEWAEEDRVFTSTTSIEGSGVASSPAGRANVRYEVRPAATTREA